MRKKEIEEEIARMAEKERELKPKIKRSDAKAFKKVRLGPSMRFVKIAFTDAFR